MGNGVAILDTITQKCFIKQRDKNTFTIILTQGLNRQIRRMCETLGFNVLKLKRTRIMNVKIDGIAIGAWRFLTSDETNTINHMLVNSIKTE